MISIMTTKKWIAIAIIAAVVIGSLALIKVFPFWATLSCLVSLVAGVIAGYIFKDKVEEVATVVNATEVADEVTNRVKELLVNTTNVASTKTTKKSTTTTKKE